MAVLSSLFATPTPTNAAVPISDGSGAAGASLDAWVTSGSGGTGDIQAMLDTISNVHGSVLFRGASAWEALAPGAAGALLQTNGPGADPSWSDVSPLIYRLWESRVDLAGGTYEADSKAICLDLSEQLEAASYFSKLIWLVPLLGSNLAAARVPLIDVLSVGIMGYTGFVDADFTQATGIKGNGSSKILDTGIKPSQLGASNNGGLGYWENQISATGTSPGEPMACWGAGNTEGYAIDFRSSNRGLYWGGFGSGALDAVAGTNGHYYGQRSSATLREAFFNGASIATNTSSDSAGGAADFTVGLMGINKSGTIFYSNCRCACAYMTDGTMSSGDIAALHTLLDTYLITPTGR